MTAADVTTSGKLKAMARDSVKTVIAAGRLRRCCMAVCGNACRSRTGVFVAAESGNETRDETRNKAWDEAESDANRTRNERGVGVIGVCAGRRQRMNPVSPSKTKTGVHIVNTR